MQGHVSHLPRARGATYDEHVTEYTDLGPPPRTRGNPRRQAVLDQFQRSTPACAGQPTSGSRRSSMTTVHPRVREATRVWFGWMNITYGPPPRARGNYDLLGVQRDSQRSTPAHAGQP